MSSSQSAIVSQTLITTSGHRLGLMILNTPQAMNAVDLDMVKLIDEQLAVWQQDPQVVAVLMRGAGDKAFSAGGDIRKLYDSMRAQGSEHLVYGDAFFTGEYGKNYRVHQFSKPLIAWGNGFVMGGGLGLYIGANHRVGTETLKLAWPEIRIGLFPDVAATWYLSRLPKPYGHWMALSGSHMNAQDCKTLGLIQYAVAHQHYETMLDELLAQPWQPNSAQNHALVRVALQNFELQSESMPVGELTAAQAELDKLFVDYDLGAIDAAFRAYAGDNAWVKQGINNYLHGCPATAQIIMEQLKRGASMSLAEVVRWELELAFQALRHPDFAEGIRAMVIDKDFQPQWQHANVQAVPRAWVQEMCSFTWPTEHPLAKL